jgi:peptidoglycan glycosyltransferase
MGLQLRRIALAFALTFALMASTAGFWSIAQSGPLLARADNPRRLLAERRAGRGAIVDRQGALLAESVGTPGDFSRHYPYPQLAPVLGYVSPFYGTAGVEAAADATLHGDEASAAGVWDWQTAVLGAPPVGRDVRLSIDLRLQAAADQALGAQVGALVLLDAATGEILALASHPTYDPNTLEADWGTLVKDSRSPLLNRATLGLYQPGGALEPIVLAAAFRAGLVQPDTPFASATADIELNGLKLGCQTPTTAGTLTLAEAFQAGCPGPLADLGDRLGPSALDQVFADFQLYGAPDIGISTAAAAHVPITAEVRSAAVGQNVLTITPLQMALVTAAIARGGELPSPQLIVARQDTAGVWQPQPPGRATISAMSPEYADEVKALMPAGRSAIALTGSPGRRLAWFSGFAPLADTRYTVAVLLEGGEPADAARMGQALLAAALTP